MLTLSLLLGSSLLTAAPSAAKDPPVQVWFNHSGDYALGDRAKVYTKAAENGYLLVLQADGNGKARVLFPVEPDGDQHIAAGKKYEVKGRGGREAFIADTKEHGTVLAAISRTPFRFDRFERDGHWDLKALNDQRLKDDPEAGLLALVEQMKPSPEHFDYDLATYVVSDQYVRAQYLYPYRWSYDPWWGVDPRFGFGLAYRPFYYRRGFRHF
jgi:hypothetical protein